MICRNGETEKLWYRSDRFFTVNNEWYFTTRENIDVGPFGSEEGARQGLNLFIEQVQLEKANEISAAAIALQGRWATTLYQ